MRSSILRAAVSIMTFSALFHPDQSAAERISVQLESVLDAYLAAGEGKELTLVLDKEECGLNVPMLSAAALDLKQYRFYSSDDDFLVLSASTSFLAGATVPDNPNVRVVIDFELKELHQTATVTVTEIDVEADRWTVLATETATCAFNAGVKIFLQTDDASPPEALPSLEEINTAFFDAGRSISAYVTLTECQDLFGTGNNPSGLRVHFQPVFGIISDVITTFDMPAYVARANDDSGRFEVRSTAIQFVNVGDTDDEVEVILTSRDPVSWETTSEEMYLCNLSAGEAVAFFAIKDNAPQGTTSAAYNKKELMFGFEEIRDSLLSGNDLRLHIDLGLCEATGGEKQVDGQVPLAVGLMPWEYIVQDEERRISFTYNYGSNSYVTTYLFQVYESGVVNATSSTYDLTGDLQGTGSSLCPLDGLAAGFTVTSSAQQQLTSYSSIVDSMKQTGRVFKSIVDLNFCKLPQIDEYGAIGSYYDANFLLNDASGPTPAPYLFSPMSGYEQKSVPEKVVILRDFPMFAFDPVDVLFNQRILDFATLEPIENDFVFACNLNDGNEGAVSVYA